MRVLVCDDDVDVGAFLRTLFELERWDAELVTSGEACLEYVATAEPPDVLVLDQVMPGLTGIETAVKLREQGFDQPIVLCSSHLGPDLLADIERLKLMPCSKLDSDALLRFVRASGNSARIAKRQPKSKPTKRTSTMTASTRAPAKPKR